MINNQESISKINLIATQLVELQTLINDSVNHTDQMDYSYPRASQVYNSILKQLKELNEEELNSVLSTFNEVEEGNFLPSGNYQYAVNLLQDVKMLHSMLIQLNVVARKVISPSCGPLGNTQCNQVELIVKNYSNKNIFLDIPFTEYEEREAILREVLEKSGLKAIIAKDKLTSNVILCKVCRHTQFCKYGIADISFGRHSVSYELGLMHGFYKKVCILLQEGSDKFTDIHGLEHVDYKGKRELGIKLSKWLLENAIEADKEALGKFITEQEQALKDEGEISFAPPILKKTPINDYENEVENSRKFSRDRFGIIKSQIGKDKYFILSATPIILGDEIVDVNQEKTKKILLHPENNRRSGWNMDFTYLESNLKPFFEGLEKKSGSFSLRLFRNGYLEFQATVDYGFSWAIEDEEEFKNSPRFNPYSIIEYPVSFMRLLKELTLKLNLPKPYIVRMAFLNCREYRLRPYGVKSFAHLSNREEKVANLDNWSYEKVFKELNVVNDSEAFSLIEVLYNTFGFSKEDIPYFNEQLVFAAE